MLNTASAIISFYERMEDQIAGFYDDLARRYPTVREAFATLSKESGKHKEMVVRAYREVITDAIEAGFSFTGLNEADYRIDTELREGLSLHDALEKALAAEERCRSFCSDASESSRALLADITHAFGWVARRKANRIEKLKSLRDEVFG